MVELRFCDICHKPVVKKGPPLPLTPPATFESILCKECLTKYGHLYHPW